MNTHFNVDKIEIISRSSKWQKEIITNGIDIPRKESAGSVEIPK
jgi:hypothetical protein